MMIKIKYAVMYFMTVLGVIIIDRNVPRESQYISVTARMAGRKERRRFCPQISQIGADSFLTRSGIGGLNNKDAKTRSFLIRLRLASA